MMAQDTGVENLSGPTAMFRGYSAERRDPIIETEDFRNEGARRMWDDYSPPYNARMYKLTAWGWSSTKDHIGVYFI
jgi:hypothetical protein